VTSDADYEQSLVRASRGRRRIVIALGVLAALGFAALGFALYRQRYPPLNEGEELTADQRAQLSGAIQRSRAALLAADRPWRAKLAAVTPSASPADAPACTRLDFYRETLARHPQMWDGWTLGELPIERRGVWSMTSTPYPFLLLSAGAPLPEHSAELSSRLADLAEEEAALPHPSVVPFASRLSRVTHEQLYATEIVLRLLAVVDPSADPGPRAYTFRAGALAAEGWMYDHRRNEVVCAGVVQVASSSSVDLGSTGLAEDLLVNLVREAPGALRALR